MKNITEFLAEALQASEAAQVNESKIKSEKEFRDYAMKMCKEAHGEDYDEDKAKETVDGFLNDNKDLVENEKWGELVGMWNKGFSK